MNSKPFIVAGAVTLCAAFGAAGADSITTRDGTTYTNAVIQRADPNGVVIEYAPRPGSVGMAKLKFANLPEDLQKRYNYNAAEAAVFEQNQAAGVARREEQIGQIGLEKKRQDDVLMKRRAEEEAMQARLAEAAALSAAQTQMGGWSGGYYGGLGGGGWYATGQKHYRFNSPGPVKPPRSEVRVDGRSGGVALTGLGTGWGDSGHFGPLPSQTSRGPSDHGSFKNPKADGFHNPNTRSHAPSPWRFSDGR